MHCKADLAPAEQYSGWQERFPMRLVTHRQTPAPTRITRRRVEQLGSGYPEASRSLARADPGCNDYEVDEDGTVWCFIESSEHYCIFQQC